jgi:uncharacterized membrane protein required for colicin V production
MTLVDGAVILVVAAGFVHGMVKGAIQEVSAAAAIVIGVFVAGKVATAGVSVMDRLSNPTVGRIFLFVAAFVVIAVGIGILGRMLSNLVKKSALSSVDRLVGGVIGACIVGLVVGLAFKLMALGGVENAAVAQSGLVRRLMGAVSYLAEFLAGGGDTVAAVFVVARVAGRRGNGP